MWRRTLKEELVGLVLAALAVSVVLPAPVVRKRPVKTGLPNLLFVTFDTTRADRLGCYGFEGVSTPSIDGLAREGIMFTNVYAQAPQTMPNHTSLFTGLYSITHDVVTNGQRLSGKALTLAEILHAAGYRTGAVVAAAPLMKEYNLHQGFGYYNDDFQDNAFFSGFKTFMRFFSANKINIPTSRPANRVAELSIEWLRHAAKQKRPFFLWVHFFDPHHPYEFHPDFDDPSVVVSEGELNQYGEKEANYINEIEFADYYLGKVLSVLESLGLTEKTLTVFTADHGESLGEHDYRGHRQEVFENVIRVPLILRWPGHLTAGEKKNSPAMSIDVMPTVLKLLEVPFLADSFQGKDLLTLPEDEPRRIFALAVKLFTKTPIRTTLVYGDYKYIEYDDPARNALYHLSEDSQELVNLIAPGRLQPVEFPWADEIRSWFEKYESIEFDNIRLSPEQLRQLRSLGYVQ